MKKTILSIAFVLAFVFAGAHSAKAVEVSDALLNAILALIPDKAFEGQVFQANAVRYDEELTDFIATAENRALDRAGKVQSLGLSIERARIQSNRFCLEKKGELVYVPVCRAMAAKLRELKADVASARTQVDFNSIAADAASLQARLRGAILPAAD